MAKCKNCKHRGGLNHVCDECINHEMFEKKVVTNADRIRNMTDEELAEHFSGLIRDTKEHEYCQDKDDWLKWLKSEVGCE